MADDRVLIWSNEHGMWWQPGHHGYTTLTHAAGRYSRTEAEAICARANLDGERINEVICCAPPRSWAAEQFAEEAGFRQRGAEIFARNAHRDQVDRAGEPYTGHLGRVAARARAHAEVLQLHPETVARVEQVAWLHDVIEDTETTEADLIRAAFPVDVVDAVQRLTKPKDLIHVNAAYLNRIEAIAAGRIMPCLVKLADVEDNLDPFRPGTADLPASLVARYQRARVILLGAIEHVRPRTGEGA